MKIPKRIELKRCFPKLGKSDLIILNEIFEKEFSKFQTMRKVRKIGPMHSMGNYMLGEDQEDDDDDECVEDDEDDEDEEEEDEDEDYDEDEDDDDDELDDDELIEDNSEEIEQKQAIKLSDRTNFATEQNSRRRPKLLHTKRARRRRSSSVISDQLTSRYSMITPQSFISDSSRTQSRLANYSSGRTSVTSGEYYPLSGAASGSISHGATTDHTPSKSAHPPSTSIVENASPAGKAKQFTKQLTRQLSKQLLRLNSSSKLPVSSLTGKGELDKKSSPDSLSTSKKATGTDINKMASEMEFTSRASSADDQLHSKRVPRGRFASFSMTPRGSIGWLFDKAYQGRSASRGELPDLERLAALGTYGSPSPTATSSTMAKQRNLMWKVRQTSAAVRHWMSSSLTKSDSFHDMINLRECVPPMYYNTKGMAKSIKVSKFYLFFFLYCCLSFFVFSNLCQSTAFLGDSVRTVAAFRFR